MATDRVEDSTTMKPEQRYTAVTGSAGQVLGTFALLTFLAGVLAVLVFDYRNGTAPTPEDTMQYMHFEQLSQNPAPLPPIVR